MPGAKNARGPLIAALALAASAAFAQDDLQATGADTVTGRLLDRLRLEVDGLEGEELETLTLERG